MGAFVPGAVVAGYRIESLLGRGGMGVVYRAWDPGLERDVALKVIAPELVEDTEIRARFLREARAAAAIEHPNVIPVHAAGDQDGVAFLAMRLVDGDDLRTIVRREGPPAIDLTCGLLEQAARALDAIHRAGFVHRDVKPGNLLVDRSGHVYLTDFGLAKQMLASTGATRTGRWVGTLDYIAPEQIRGGRIDARADVYALGGVLHYVLTGHVPFERDHDEAKLWAQLSDPPPAPSTLRPDTPVALDAVVARAMAKVPDERFPSAGDLARAARAAATGAAPAKPERMVARGAAAPGTAPTEPGLVAEASTVTSGASPPARRRGRRAVLAGVLLAAAVAGVVAVLADGGSEPPARPKAEVARPAPRVMATTPDVGRRPTGIAFAGGDLWVTSVSEPRVTRIDAATGRERPEHPLVGAGPASIAAYRDDIWVVARRAGEVIRLDARTGEVGLRIRTPAPPRNVAAGVNGVWIATDAETGDELRRYDRDGNQLARFAFNAGVVVLAVSPDAAWVVEERTNRLVRIEPRTGKRENWATVHAPPVALHYGGGYVWAALRSDDVVDRVDAKTRSVVTAAAGQGPTQMVAVGDRLYVASRNDSTVVVLDMRTTQPAHAALPVKLNPYALATDGRSVWVTGLGENTVTRIATGA